MIIKPFTEELHDLDEAIFQFSTGIFDPTPSYHCDVNEYLHPNNSGESSYRDINNRLHPIRPYNIKTYLCKPIFCDEESFAVHGGKGNKILYNPTELDDLDRIMLSLKEKRNKSSFSCLCCGRPMSAGVRRCPDCGCYFPELYEKFDISQNLWYNI